MVREAATNLMDWRPAPRIISACGLGPRPVPRAVFQPKSNPNPQQRAWARTPTPPFHNHCNPFAEKAAWQVEQKNQKACHTDPGDPRWSSDRDAHYAWCIEEAARVNWNNPDLEAQARDAFLRTCRPGQAASPGPPGQVLLPRQCFSNVETTIRCQQSLPTRVTGCGASEEEAIERAKASVGVCLGEGDNCCSYTHTHWQEASAIAAQAAPQVDPNCAGWSTCTRGAAAADPNRQIASHRVQAGCAKRPRRAGSEAADHAPPLTEPRSRADQAAATPASKAADRQTASHRVQAGWAAATPAQDRHLSEGTFGTPPNLATAIATPPRVSTCPQGMLGTPPKCYRPVRGRLRRAKPATQCPLVRTCVQYEKRVAQEPCRPLHPLRGAPSMSSQR